MLVVKNFSRKALHATEVDKRFVFLEGAHMRRLILVLPLFLGAAWANRPRDRAPGKRDAVETDITGSTARLIGHWKGAQPMIGIEALQEAVDRIVVQAGIEPPHPYYLHHVSPGKRGFFIFEVAWPSGARIFRAVRHAAPSLPLLTYPGYIALLPEVAQEIVSAAHRLRG